MNKVKLQKLMRPTDLGFRSPKERTPAFYTSTVSYLVKTKLLL